MKCFFIILTSLLLVNLCFSVAVDVPDTQLQNINADPEDAASQQKSTCSLLSTVEDIRKFFGNKWHQIQHLLRGDGADALKPVNYGDESIFSENELYIGDFLANYTLAYVEYANVKAVGLNEFKKSEVRLEPNNIAKLVVRAPGLRVSGNYTLFNKLKRASGLFEVVLSQITYTETSYIQQYNDIEFDIPKSDASIQYSKLSAEYKDIGFFTKFLSGSIAGKLVNKVVLPLLAKEIGAEARTIYLRELKQLASNAGTLRAGTKSDNKLEEIIRTAVSEARHLLEKGGYSHIALSNPTIEFLYTGQIMKIVELNISGLSAFEVKNTSIVTQNNFVRVDVEVITSKVNTSAVVNVGDTVNPSRLPPSWFTSNYIDAHISFEKELNKDDAWFKLVQVVVQIDKLEPIYYDNQGNSEWRDLIFNELPRILAEEINKRLADLVKSAINISISDARTGQVKERLSL